MASFAFIVPENFKKKVDEGLYAFDLTKAEIVSGNIDQIKGVWLGEFKLVMKNEQANAQLASVLAFGKTVASATFGAEFGDTTFGVVLPAGLSRDTVLNDLTVVGSLAGGGDLGEVDLVYVPEPSSVVLLALGLVIGLTRLGHAKNQD